MRGPHFCLWPTCNLFFYKLWVLTFRCAALVLHDALLISHNVPIYFRYFTSLVYCFSPVICMASFWQVEISWATIQSFTEGIRPTSFRRNVFILSSIWGIATMIPSVIAGMGDDYYWACWRICWIAISVNLLALFSTIDLLLFGFQLILMPFTSIWPFLWI